MWYRSILAQAHQDDVYRRELPIPVSGTLEAIMRVLAENGKRALIVGGSVRDAIQGKVPKDIDVEVYGISYDDLGNLLSRFGRIDVVGKSFGVIKLRDKEGNDFDFSIPRRENKTGIGHKEFQVSFDPTITPKEAASRRDFTFNALAYDPLSKEIHDYYGGVKDLENKTIRHTSPAFAEDPLRVLRGMQFAARFGMDLAPETAEMIRGSLSDPEHYNSLAKERIAEEWMKLATKGKYPGRALQYLKDTGWIRFFPEIENMVGVPQDSEWHPEGWSTSIVPADFLRTSMTQPMPINLLTREIVQRSIAGPTGAPLSNVARKTEAFVKKGIFARYLLATLHTRVGDFALAPPVDAPASVAPAKGFVFNARFAAQQANKVVRVMFKVPLSRMATIMDAPINDLKIVQGVIESVAVHMVNMLSGGESPSKVLFHDEPVEEHRSTDSGNGNLGISARIMNPVFSIVDNDVVFDFDLGVVGDVDIHTSQVPGANEAYLVNYGDVGTHTAHVMDAAAEIADRDKLEGDDRAAAIFAALGHDFAKAHTTEMREKGGKMRWTAHGHEEASGPLVEQFLKNIGVKKEIIQRVRPIVERHLEHIRFKPGTTSPSTVRQLADAIHPGTIEELARLMEADASGRPPLPKGLPDQARVMLELARRDNSHAGRPVPIISGRHVMPYFGNEGGPHIGEAVKDAYKAQLQGRFSDEEEGKSWLHNYIRNKAQILKGNDFLPFYEGKGGPHIAEDLNAAWEAQNNGEFSDADGAQSWLGSYMQNKQTPK